MAMARDTFHWADYVIFILVLAASVGIGLYQSFTGGHQKTRGEYFLGNRAQSPVPVAMSILMSFMSAVVILGSTAEMYISGTQWYMLCFGAAFISYLLTAILFIPLIHPLQLTSATEYLELRFRSVAVKLLGTLLLIASQLLYMGVAVYSPATALEAATGFQAWISILCIIGVATLYTSLGGMKAVIWTDVFQYCIMTAGLIAIVVVGITELGGLSEVWKINQEWNRIEFFNFDFDPKTKHTFWSTIFGGGVSFFGIYAVNQVAVQRYCSLPTVTQARVAILLNIPGVIVLYTLISLTGIVIFAYFTKQGCDPLANKDVANANQLLPHFMMQVLAYPGVPGVFVATLFAGALSTISSSLNALSAATWEDMLKWKLHKLPDSRQTLIVKMLVVFFGCLGLGMSFAAQFMGATVTRAAASFYFTSMSPLLGLFFLGSVFPWANWIGALVGGITGLFMVMWISVGSVFLKYPSKPLPFNTANCSNIEFTNVTAAPFVPPTLSGIEPLYSMSYLWFPGIGITVTIVMGLIISFATGPTQPRDVDRKYLMPLFDWLCCCLPESCRAKCRCGYTKDGGENAHKSPKYENYTYKPANGSVDLVTKF